MRRYTLLDLGRVPAPNDEYIDISLDDARHLVAKEQRRTEHVLDFDDHVDPNAYWPVFIALTA